MMRRREVLKLLALAATGCVLPARPAAAQPVATLIPVPPSVMLHARQAHLDNMRRLLDWLAERAYTPITYRTLWAALTAGQPLPPQPVIVTIDDLTLVRGSSNFAFIARLVDTLLEYEAAAVLGIITEPVVLRADGRAVRLRDQDDALWQQAAGWQARGIELATHTRSHRNLAENGITSDELHREICESAALIEAQTGVPARTLVLPFGNGATDSYGGVLCDSIAGACRTAGIGVVAGIGGGRVPLVPAPAAGQPVYFVGRVGPLADQYSSIFGDIENWRR